MEKETWTVFVDSVEVHTAGSLSDAMEHAKSYSGFVSIKGHGHEILGKFGVDSVEDSKLPDGHGYDWKMRRDENHRSSRKKLV